jgi:hypothetical protein
MAATLEQLRKDIDSGRTRDKVTGPDPAAAPLGADEEAAGTPLSPHRATLARDGAVDAPPRSSENGGRWVYAAIVALLAAIFIAAAFVRR